MRSSILQPCVGSWDSFEQTPVKNEVVSGHSCFNFILTQSHYPWTADTQRSTFELLYSHILVKWYKIFLSFPPVWNQQWFGTTNHDTYFQHVLAHHSFATHLHAPAETFLEVLRWFRLVKQTVQDSSLRPKIGGPRRRTFWTASSNLWRLHFGYALHKPSLPLAYICFAAQWNSVNIVLIDRLIFEFLSSCPK